MKQEELTPQEQETLLWILAKADLWGLEFQKKGHEEINGISQHFYSCRLSKMRPEALGYGHDTNAWRAQLKAAIEAIERLVVFNKKWDSTSGVALHSNPALAELNAKNEAYERDAFFCHFLSGTPFSPLLTQDEQSWKKSLPGDVQCCLRLAHSHESVHVVLAALKSKHGGVGICLGLGAHQSMDLAILHAQRECVALFSFLKSSHARKNYSLKEFNAQENVTVHDHGLLGTDMEYAKWFWETYLDVTTAYRTSTSVDPEVLVEKIPAQDLPDNPLYIAYATSSKLQRPYWNNKKHQVNENRLTEFTNKKWTADQLPRYSHCFA